METYFSVSKIEKFIENLFLAYQCDKASAFKIAQSIVSISSAGIDTHGINRVPVYIRAIKNGRINNKPIITVEREGAVARIDADNGMGHIAALKAMDIGMDIAGDLGIGIVYVQHSNHFGAAYEYCRIAAEKHFASLIFTNAPQAVAPFGAAEPFFGTNPISIGFPHRDFPIIVDLSTSATARGKILKAKEENKEIPLGWAVDSQGQPTTDAAKAINGTLLSMAGPKGYALAFAVEMFGAVLADAALSNEVGYLYDDSLQPCNVGHCFIFISERGPFFDTSIDMRTAKLINALKNVQTAKGIDEILIPGEDRKIIREKRMVEGVPINQPLLEQLNLLANQVGVEELTNE